MATNLALFMRFTVYMSLSIFWSHRIPAVASSSSSFYARRVGFIPRNSSFFVTNNRCSFPGTKTRRPVASSAGRYLKTSTVHPRSMSSSLKDSPQSSDGLSDIGAQSNKSWNNDSHKVPNWKERIDISIAKSRKIRGSNYVQISTIDYETMEPRCRTVVFRGFMKGVPFGAVKEVIGSGELTEGGMGDEDANYDCAMKMITDLRSNKVSELQKFHEMAKDNAKTSNTAEIVWWFPKSSEQYRVQGRLQFIGSNGPLFTYTDDNTNEQNTNYFVAERKQQWGNLSDMAREQFYWENPGLPFISAAEQAKGVQPGGRDEEGKVLPVPDTFLIMLLYPKKIDYLRLGDNYRQVDEWNSEGGEYQWKSLRVNP